MMAEKSNSPCYECIEKPCQFIEGDPRCSDYKEWKEGGK